MTDVQYETHRARIAAGLVVVLVVAVVASVLVKLTLTTSDAVSAARSSAEASRRSESAVDIQGCRSEFRTITIDQATAAVGVAATDLENARSDLLIEQSVALEAIARRDRPTELFAIALLAPTRATIHVLSDTLQASTDQLTDQTNAYRVDIDLSVQNPAGFLRQCRTQFGPA